MHLVSTRAADPEPLTTLTTNPGAPAPHLADALVVRVEMHLVAAGVRPAVRPPLGVLRLRDAGEVLHRHRLDVPDDLYRTISDVLRL